MIALIKIVGKEGVLYTPEDLAVYSYDGTFAEGRPDVVVLPETTEQVSQVVKLAAETRTPMVPRGMGSGLAAGSIPLPSGGIVVCLTRMNHILEIDTENATVRAEAGVVTADLQSAVEKHGLFYPPDPSSIRHSTIGGNIACNAGGPRCLKYGVTGDYVLGLTVVLADGRILKTGGKPIKDVTGYDLNGLVHRFRRDAGRDHRGAAAPGGQTPLCAHRPGRVRLAGATPRARSTPS